MTTSETAILRYFRHYQVGVNEMLFFNATVAKSHERGFHRAMTALIDNGLVVEERRRHAYSLTCRGYRASLRISPDQWRRERTTCG